MNARFGGLIAESVQHHCHHHVDWPDKTQTKAIRMRKSTHEKFKTENISIRKCEVTFSRWLTLSRLRWRQKVSSEKGGEIEIQAKKDDAIRSDRLMTMTTTVK